MASLFKCLLSPLSRTPSRSSLREPPVPRPPPSAMVPAPFILLPLYLYPSPGTWDPLTHAVQTHPTVHFVVVLNPDSGPGLSARPDSNYCTAVEALAQFPNVHLLGYVGVSHGARSHNECMTDIDRYRGWNAGGDDSTQTQQNQPQERLRVDGVFLNEVASDSAAADSVGRLAHYVRDTWMRDQGRKGLVVYNPGVPVDTCFFNEADCVVVVEDTDKKLVEFADVIRAGVPEQAGKTAACIHSFKGTGDELEGLLTRLIDLGMAGVFVTDQDGGGYNQWPVAWEEQTQWLSEREKKTVMI